MAPEPAEVTETAADARVPWRVFVVVGLVIGVMFLVYGPTSKEHAGSVMLAVASILALWCGAFLWRNARRIEQERTATPGAAVSGHGDGAYLPDASPWPFGIGLGVTLGLNGLLIGVWFLIPGLMVLTVSLAGFARQSRHRT